ncbi:hypothetical protein F2Q69_00048451 [Brassica cretica]|uniref:Uncharacterized protein n=1 Tax=Brassica cretica TaxID=69181 RepID=A0A8S9PVV0_BRACR|nr:hypothetical protein F2Q69_00048451 [Brassica cretica]
MQVDEATEGRVLRKRKEKTPKNLKREANEKEMDGFTKRVLRIPVEKQFDEVYFTHQLNDLGYIAACHCGAEYKIEYSELIDTHTARSIDSNESPMTDERYPTSLDGMQPVDHSTLPDQFYPDFAFQQPNKNGRDDYSIGSWADSGFHESFAVETVILSSNEDPSKEYEEDYWKERATGLLCRMKDIQPIPSTIRLHHRSTGTTQHRDQDCHARAMDGRILQVSREDISNIVQLANGVDNLFTQQRSIPDNNPTVLDVYPKATTTGIGSHQTCKPVSHASINEVTFTSLDRFRWEHKKEYGVYRDESGHARSTTGDMISVTKDDIRKILERASLFGEGHICLPKHATSFTPTTLAPEIYTKDEINDMVTGICGTQDIEPESLAEKKDEWEIAYINTRFNDVYNALNNNVDWLSTRIDLLQQELDTIRMNDPQPATSIDICNIKSIDARFAAIEDRLKSYEDMQDRFTSPIMRYLDTLSTQMTNVQKDIGKLNDQHDF